MCGIGWWILIGGFAWGTTVCADTGPSNSAVGYAWLPLFGATVFYLMINGMRWSELRDDGMGDEGASTKAKLFLLFSFLIALGSITGAVFILMRVFPGPDCREPGICTLAGTLAVMLGAFIQRMGTLPPTE